MRKLYFSLLAVVVAAAGAWCGWTIYWYQPYFSSVLTCGVNVQMLTRSDNDPKFLVSGSDINLVVGKNRMLVRGKYHHGGKVFSISRIINFSYSLTYPETMVTVSSVQKQVGDNLSEDVHAGLQLVKGDQFDILYKKTYGNKYILYIDNFKFGECQELSR